MRHGGCRVCNPSPPAADGVKSSIGNRNAEEDENPPVEPQKGWSLWGMGGDQVDHSGRGALGLLKVGPARSKNLDQLKSTLSCRYSVLVQRTLKGPRT